MRTVCLSYVYFTRDTWLTIWLWLQFPPPSVSQSWSCGLLPTFCSIGFLIVHAFSYPFTLFMIPSALLLLLCLENSLTFVALIFLIHRVPWRKLLILHLTRISAGETLEAQ